MAGEMPIPVSSYPDDYTTWTFGPFSASSADQILPWVPDRDVVIDRIGYIFRVAGSTGATFAILNRDNSADTTVASTVSAARTILAATSLDTGVAVNPNTYTETYTLSTYNLVKRGNQLVIDFAGTLTNLADFFVEIRYRSKKK